MTAQVLIVIPVLRRPHRALPVVESIRASTPAGVARVLFVGSPGDEQEHDACRATGEDLMVIDDPVVDGDWARKINTAVRCSDEPTIFLGADDLHFHAGWWEAASRRLVGCRQVIGTNDLGNPRVQAGVHATHMLVARDYIDRRGTIDEPGKVLHEGYPHEWVDDEMVGTARMRGAWSFAHDSIVEHLHPSWGKAAMDDLYAAQRERMQRGKQLFDKRRHLWEQGGMRS